MIPAIYQVGGGITSEHAGVYIERAEDQNIDDLLRQGNYVLVVEPRQQGKTSLLNALMRRPGPGRPVFAYANITTLDTSSEAGWYQGLCPRLLKQLRFLKRDQWPSIPHNSFTWRDFLSDISLAARDQGLQIVIALDEIGAVNFPGAIAFFSVLRDIFNARQGEPEFSQITFILVGAFHPRDLIEDIHVSPFNIARRERLPDFNFEQVARLVTLGGWPEPLCSELAERIFYWTDGQPYLTHYLCSKISQQATPEEVDQSVEAMRREDENHFPAILTRLERDSKMRAYLRRIFQGETLRYFPAENRRQAELDVLGVIKPDRDGFCVIRNRIYRAALREICVEDASLSPPVGPQPASGNPVYNIHIDQAQGTVIGDDAKIDQNYNKKRRKPEPPPPGEGTGG